MRPDAVALDELAREVDMIVYRLERAAPSDAAAREAERAALRRELERIRDRLEDLVSGLLTS